MTTAALKTANKSALCNGALQRGKERMSVKVLTDQDLLKDMQAYGKKVSATPEAARDFLIRLGVMTRDGKVKNLIRD